MEAVIEDLKVRKILDSRGNPTVEVDVATTTGFGRTAAPSGASTGVMEVTAFPEGGVGRVVAEFDAITSELIGMDASDTKSIDEILKEVDGTESFSSIGGNTAVAVSLAAAKAAASSYNMPLYQFLGGNFACELPYPLGNMINGGAHAGKNAPDIQEFLVSPVGAKNITEAVFTNVSVHKTIKELIQKKDQSFTGGKGDEGGWAPNLSNQDTLDIQITACERVSEETGVTVKPGLDLAPSGLWDSSEGVYNYKREGVRRSSGEQIDFVEDIIKTYGLFYVEDPFHEADFQGFTELTRNVGEDCIICGDDIFVTNPEILMEGINRKAANAIIIKPNQIGTLSDTYRTVKLAKNHSYMPVVSHRSGETTDETIAHLAVAFSCPLIKTGAVGGERIAKLNELIRIEEDISNPAMAKLR